ncbi:MAG: glycosyltransferase family 2 protein [Proteobacteria bacterium]|nr:glycosyltransferase family 2 protein [Pseudomonadota bacterium]
MSVSIIVATFRTGNVLGDCLAAAVRADLVDEVIIVDNGNPAAETATIDAFAASPKVRVVRGQGNVGFARACNMGAAVARNGVLVFVNPDVVLNADAPARLAAALNAAPPPAVIGGDLRDNEGRPERGSRRERLTFWRAFVTVTGLSRLERWAPAFRDFNRHTDPMPREAVRVSCISGALFALRKADYDAIGGLDEGYFLHVDDVDLCRRAEQRGWPVLFLPGPHGVHARSTSQVNPHTVFAHKARGMARYFQKFGANPIERGVAGLVGAFLSLTAPRP